jgi:hypothetical protein
MCSNFALRNCASFEVGTSETMLNDLSASV